MVEQLLVYERDAFLALNGSHTPFWDNFFWIYTGKVVWLPLAAFILFVLVYKKDWRESLLILLAIALVITLCDQFASGFCKDYFHRFRPTHHPDFKDVVKTAFGYRGGMYGFISSHAANAFGFAMFMTLLFREKVFGWTIFFWAMVTAYSRIYLGVHFISDIIPGALSGVFFGYIVYLLYAKVRKCWLKGKIEPFIEKPSERYSDRRKHAIVCAIFLTISVIVLANNWLVRL